jgi:hypothetical protein
LVAVKVDNDPRRRKMSQLGTEAQLLARLMEQARKAKMAAGGDQGAVASGAAEGDGSDEEVPLQTRLRQKKRKALAGSSADPEGVPAARPLQDVVTATGLTVGEHVPAPSKKSKLVTVASKDTRSSKLSVVAKEAQLEDEGFIRHVAERLKSAGLDRLVHGHGSPRENRAKAFDSVLRGLHNLYLVDSMEEDLRLKEQVAALESGLLVEQTEKKNVIRQRDNFKAKLEKAVAEKAGTLARVATLEEENAQLKAKIAELPHVVAQERKAATDEALAGFMVSAEMAGIKAEEYGRGFNAGYEKHFHTLIEKDWINVEKYYADMERESAAQPEQVPEPSAEVQPEGSVVEPASQQVPGDEPGPEGVVVEKFGDEVKTPERQPADVAPDGADTAGLKANGDPLTPGITPTSGPVHELD